MRYSATKAKLDVLGDFRGAPQTVALVKKYAIESQRDPSVRLIAEEVIQGIGPKDYLSECLALYNFVLRYCRYTNDPRSVELVRKPSWVVSQIAAGRTPSLDCDDLCCLLSALLLSIGRETRAVTVAFRNAHHNGERQYSHIYVQVKEPRTNRWITLDPVAAEDTSTMLKRVRALKIWPIA